MIERSWSIPGVDKTQVIGRGIATTAKKGGIARSIGRLLYENSFVPECVQPAKRLESAILRWQPAMIEALAGRKHGHSTARARRKIGNEQCTLAVSRSSKQARIRQETVPANIDYLGITMAPSFGKESSVALSIPRWASTSSGGVCVSHSDNAKS